LVVVVLSEAEGSAASHLDPDAELQVGPVVVELVSTRTPDDEVKMTRI
jgi:hypothetical protein